MVRVFKKRYNSGMREECMRENVLVYLSNAVEKYCTDTGFAYTGQWHKWGPYGFDKDGRIRLEEYYPYALESTYRGVSGVYV